jgi:hypothetical protein
MRWIVRVGTVLGLLGAVGCGRLNYQDCAAGPAQPVVMRSIQAMGGAEAWNDVGTIDATALVTSYDADGEGHVNEQHQTYHLRKGTLEVEASRPEGDWWAWVTAAGTAKLTAYGFEPSEEFRSRMLSSLATILHRVRGPLNLCDGGDVPGDVTSRHVDGRDYVRVGVRESATGVAAYYFDPGSHLLRMVTAGADRPGGDGTVTVYTYRMDESGLVFPERISVHRIGQYELVGQRKVLEVHFTEVRF